MRSKTIIYGLFAFSALRFAPSISAEVSQANAIVDEIRWIQAESFISIATKYEIPLSKAPGIATVITAQQIKQMGFKTLSEVLKTVPGFNIQMDRNGEFEFANYTYQNGEDTRFKNRLPDVPIHKANFGVNLGLGKYVNANLHTFLSGPRPREQGDTRPDLPSYALFDLTVTRKNFIDNVEVRGSVRNLFGKGYDDPAPRNTVPTDYPQQGSSFFVELQYKF